MKEHFTVIDMREEYFYKPTGNMFMTFNTEIQHKRLNCCDLKKELLSYRSDSAFLNKLALGGYNSAQCTDHWG